MVKSDCFTKFLLGAAYLHQSKNRGFLEGIKAHIIHTIFFRLDKVAAEISLILRGKKTLQILALKQISLVAQPLVERVGAVDDKILQKFSVVGAQVAPLCKLQNIAVYQKLRPKLQQSSLPSCKWVAVQLFTNRIDGVPQIFLRGGGVRIGPKKANQLAAGNLALH